MGLKLARPRWFDGTALCIGSMGPDLGYAFSSYLQVDTHDWDGMPLVFGLVAVFTVAARWVAAATVPAQLPDLGSWRLRSWRVTWRAQPAWWVTASSMLLGIGTHIVLDWFTHPGRPGPRWLGYDDISVTLFGHREPLAGVFQLLGHTAGSLAGLWLLWLIGRRHLLERWYGEAAVATARSVALTLRGRVAFWSIVVASGALGLAWGFDGDRLEFILRPIVATGIGAVAASALPVCQPSSMENVASLQGARP